MADEDAVPTAEGVYLPVGRDSLTLDEGSYELR